MSGEGLGCWVTWAVKRLGAGVLDHKTYHMQFFRLVVLPFKLM